MADLFPPTTIDDKGLTRLCCNVCGQPVSTAILPVVTDPPDDEGLVVRAFIQCLPCLAKYDEVVRRWATRDTKP
jgi:hypothetical protein